MLDVRDIWKSYEKQPLLRGVSFQVGERETVCLLGSSGSGKSTLLRMIAGLEQPEQGQILWNSADLAGVPVHQRNFGLMFQDYALFPHRNVAENVAFGLRMQHLPDVQIRQRVAESLERVNLASFAHRQVTDLSGGEQQRVALARAIAPRPNLLMLDEPLGALDRTLREQLTLDLRQLLHSTGIPAIYVTHDQEEACAIANRLILLHEGRVIQSGTPAQVYQHPASPWVARFLGMNNLLDGQVISAHPLVVHSSLGDLRVEEDSQVFSPGKKVTLLIRPNAAHLPSAPDSPNIIRGQVTDSVLRGDGFRLSFQSDSGVELHFAQNQAFEPGVLLTLSLDPHSVSCLE